jgi:hypothetical protein
VSAIVKHGHIYIFQTIQNFSLGCVLSQEEFRMWEISVYLLSLPSSIWKQEIRSVRYSMLPNDF